MLKPDTGLVLSLCISLDCLVNMMDGMENKHRFNMMYVWLLDTLGGWYFNLVPPWYFVYLHSTYRHRHLFKFFASWALNFDRESHLTITNRIDKKIIIDWTLQRWHIFYKPREQTFCFQFEVSINVIVSSFSRFVRIPVMGLHPLYIVYSFSVGIYSIV